MEVLEAIKTRRSIRKYKDTQVKDKDLDKILEAARWAPSWANTQCVSFIIVKDKEIKSKLAETLTPTNPALQAISEAPILIAACAELGKSGFKHDEVQTDKGDWFMFDAGIAMQNLVLAAHSLGLGTVYIGLFDASKANNILNLPDEMTTVALTPLGYPDSEPNIPKRKESSETVFYNVYNKIGSEIN